MSKIDVSAFNNVTFALTKSLFYVIVSNLRMA
jgi:hypothetical protein